MRDIFRYTPGTSIIHRMNPLTKVLLTISICVAAFLTDSILFLAFLLLLDLSIGILAGIPQKAFSILKGLLKIAAFLFVIQVLMTRSGQPVFWIITDTGLITAAKVVLRLMVVCMPLALVLAVTQISDLANAMVQVLHVPYAYAFTVTTAIRFIPQFLEEMDSIVEAQTARGVDFDAKGSLRKLGMMLPLCAPLLITSVRRTDATAVAAEIRGFELRTPASGYKRYPFLALDIATALCSALLIVAAAVLPKGILSTISYLSHHFMRLQCAGKPKEK